MEANSTVSDVKYSLDYLLLNFRQDVLLHSNFGGYISWQCHIFNFYELILVIFFSESNESSSMLATVFY
jgi:hypothetical protein